MTSFDSILDNIRSVYYGTRRQAIHDMKTYLECSDFHVDTFKTSVAYLCALIQFELNVSCGSKPDELSKSIVIAQEALTLLRRTSKRIYSFKYTKLYKEIQQYLSVLQYTHTYGSNCISLTMQCISDILEEHRACVFLHQRQQFYHMFNALSKFVIEAKNQPIINSSYYQLIQTVLRKFVKYSQLSKYLDSAFQFYIEVIECRCDSDGCQQQCRVEDSIVFIVNMLTDHALRIGFASEHTFAKCLHLRKHVGDSILCNFFTHTDHQALLDFFSIQVRLKNFKIEQSIADKVWLSCWAEQLESLCVSSIKAELRKARLVRKSSTTFDHIDGMLKILFTIVKYDCDDDDLYKTIDKMLPDSDPSSLRVVLILRVYLLFPDRLNTDYILDNVHTIQELQLSWISPIVNECLLKGVTDTRSQLISSLRNTAFYNSTDIPSELILIIKHLQQMKRVEETCDENLQSEIIAIVEKFEPSHKFTCLSGALIAVTLVSLALQWFQHDLITVTIAKLMKIGSDQEYFINQKSVIFRSSCCNQILHQYISRSLTQTTGAYNEIKTSPCLTLFMWSCTRSLQAIVKEAGFYFLEKDCQQWCDQSDINLIRLLEQYFDEHRWDDIILLLKQLLCAAEIAAKLSRQTLLTSSHLFQLALRKIKLVFNCGNCKHGNDQLHDQHNDVKREFSGFTNQQIALNAPTVCLLNLIDVVFYAGSHYSNINELATLLRLSTANMCNQLELLCMYAKCADRNVPLQLTDVLSRAHEFRQDKIFTSMLIDYVAKRVYIESPMEEDIKSFHELWAMAFHNDAEQACPLDYQISLAKCGASIYLNVKHHLHSICSIKESIINDVLFSSAPALRRCISAALLVTSYEQIDTNYDRVKNLLGNDIMFEHDFVDMLTEIGLNQWPRYVADVMVIALKYLPLSKSSLLEKLLLSPSNYQTFSITQLNRIKMIWDVNPNCEQSITDYLLDKHAQLHHTSFNNCQHQSQYYDNTKLAVEMLTSYFYGQVDIDKVKSSFQDIHLDCNYTKILMLLASDIISSNSIDNEPIPPFLHESIEFLVNKTRLASHTMIGCQSNKTLTIDRDIFVEFQLPQGLKTKQIFIEKKPGWYFTDEWILNLRRLLRSTLFGSNLAMWITSDECAQLMFISDLNLSTTIIQTAIEKLDDIISENTSNENTYCNFHQLAGELIKLTCGLDSVWLKAFMANPSSAYFICPLILRASGYKLANNLLTYFKSSGWYAVEMLLFIMCNEYWTLTTASFFTEQAYISGMFKSALMIATFRPEIDTNDNFRLLFDIFKELNAFDDCRAVSKHLDANEGYEKVEQMRQRALHNLQTWDIDEAEYNSFQISFQHLLAVNDNDDRRTNRQCCMFFSKLQDTISNRYDNQSSNKPAMEFFHELLHGRVQTKIENNLKLELLKLPLLKRASDHHDKQSLSINAFEFYSRSVNLVNKFPGNVNHILKELNDLLPPYLILFCKLIDFYHCCGERELAFDYLQKLITDHRDILLLKTYVEWIDQDRKYENVKSVFSVLDAHANWFSRESVNSTSSHVERNHFRMAAAEAYDILAGFMYHQYLSSREHVESKEFVNKKKTIYNSRLELTNTKDKSKYKTMLQEYTKLDMIDVEQTMTEYEHVRIATLKSLVKTLQFNWTVNNAQELRVLQLITVLFHTYDIEESDRMILRGVHEELDCGMFLPVARQLTAKISTTSIELNRLVAKMLCKHPFHMIPLLLCVESDDNQSDNHNNKEVVHQILIENKENYERIKQYRKLFIFYGSLCENKKSIKKIPSKCLASLFLNSLSLISIPTLEIVDHEQQNNVYPIKFYPDIVELPGITAPRVVTCLCSDGRTIRQIIKFGDDLRQDALIQQTFFIINNIFLSTTSDSSIYNEGFNLRRYIICPITKKCGVIEYCEGTISLSKYLIDPISGAHTRFRRKFDFTSDECRKLLHNNAYVTKEQKLKVFVHIYDKFKPVFRYFFLEKFHEPLSWYKHVKRFTRSVACSSIIGYILGLGDRHLNNILIDEQTAEVIHIDFGIAFEQGRILPVPEVVPFRLTRDIVDGFGPSGPFGLFRSSAIQCLTVLISNKSIMDAIINVLVDDPLCNWTLDSVKVQKYQPLDAVNQIDKVMVNAYITTDLKCRNNLAERAIFSIRQKLNIENSATTIANKVNELIAEATNLDNLCRMYSGWQAFV